MTKGSTVLDFYRFFLSAIRLISYNRFYNRRAATPFCYPMQEAPPKPKDPESPKEPKEPKELNWLETVEKAAKEKFVSWGLSGVMLALAAHFAREQNWKVAIALTVAAGLVAILLRFFDKLSPHLDKLFEWLANNFVGWLQRLWWKLTAQFQGRYYESLIFACRDFRTQGLKTKGPFTLDLEKVFVPLRVAPESAEQVMAGMLQGRGANEGLKIWDFLAQLKKQPAFRRIVLIAPPGAGKSTLLEHLTLTYAQNTQRRRDRRAPKLIPVLLYLRNVRGTIASDQPPDLATLIEQQESIQSLNPKGWFKRNLDQGKCLVMLDGLDEVADEAQRQKVSQWVDRQMQRYPKTPFILTSRPFGYRSAPLSQVGTVLEVKPFSLREMNQFVGNWYLQHEIMSRLGKNDRGGEGQCGPTGNGFDWADSSYIHLGRDGIESTSIDHDCHGASFSRRIAGA
jgi:NACHT domain